jgi:undecaprenyl-phosphate galactose phosphotransferase
MDGDVGGAFDASSPLEADYFASYQTPPQPGWLSGETSKTMMDFGLAGVLLFILLPVLVCIAVLVSLDGGPIVFKHQRVGRFGRTFPCFKFRSMAVGGDKILNDLLVSDPVAAAEWESTRKLRRDPRVTFVGKILRTTSLDEIPQLFNVLRREMSLVGPRPIVTDEVRLYEDKIRHYYDVRPGITGLWQVCGRSNASYDERVRLDTWYVENRSIWLDLKILLSTVPAVLSRTGAH